MIKFKFFVVQFALLHLELVADKHVKQLIKEKHVIKGRNEKGLKFVCVIYSFLYAIQLTNFI